MSDVTMTETAFFLPRGDAGFEATPVTRGPWDNRFQHGGPPAALMGGAMARFGDDAGDFTMVRVTVDLLRPVPIGRLALSIELERPGCTAQHLRAALFASDQQVARARGLRLRRTALEVSPPPSPSPWSTSPASR